MYVLTVLLNGPLKRNMNLKCLMTVGAPGWLLIFGLQVPAPRWVWRLLKNKISKKKNKVLDGQTKDDQYLLLEAICKFCCHFLRNLL